MGARELQNYSYEDYLQIDATTPDEERYELIFGEIYMMSGASGVHQDIVLNIAILLKQLSTKGCKTRIAPYDLKLSCATQTHVVQPDVLLLCQESTLPCAVFEVLSPSTATKDKTVKKELYEVCGIQEYFIISAEYKTVDKYTLEDGRYMIKSYGIEDELELTCAQATLKVADIFEDIQA